MSGLLSRTLGQQAAKNDIAMAWDSRRFPHALLLYGAPGAGQNALALDTAQMLLCESRHEQPCGHCPGCIAFKAESLDNLYFLLPLRKAGRDTDGEGLDPAVMEEFVESRQAWFRDPYLYSWPEKSGIGIQQVRELQRQLLYAESRGRRRVILLPYVESLRQEAANALLKTLEEPPKDTYFILTSEDRAGLLPTLLSRCTHIALTPLSDAELTDVLTAWKSRLPEGPKASLIPLAQGSPGAYIALHERGEDDLEAVAQFLAAALELETSAFIEFVESGEAFSGMEPATRLLEMALRIVWLEQKHRVAPLQGHVDVKLQAALAPLRGLKDLAPFAAYLEDALRALRQYVKPQNAVLGLFLEYEAKALEAGKAP